MPDELNRPLRAGLRTAAALSLLLFLSVLMLAVSGNSTPGWSTQNFASQPEVAVYDVNNDGIIQRTEATSAVVDFFAGRIPRSTAVAVVVAFFA